MDAIVKKKKTKGNRNINQRGSATNPLELKLLIDFSSSTEEVDNMQVFPITPTADFDSIIEEVKNKIPAVATQPENAPSFENYTNVEFYDEFVEYYKQYREIPAVVAKVYSWDSENPRTLYTDCAYPSIRFNKNHTYQLLTTYDSQAYIDFRNWGGFIEVPLCHLDMFFNRLDDITSINIFTTE